MNQIFATAESEIIAQFYDLDPMNVVWHGHYARFFEVARSALLNKINYNYQEMKNSGFMWPIIDMHVRYIKPITLGQAVRVRADLIEHEFRLKIQYTMFDAKTDQRICKGHTCQVAVDIKTGDLQITSPEILLKRIDSAK